MSGSLAMRMLSLSYARLGVTARAKSGNNLQKSSGGEGENIS
ncbi:MAG: hypothetical protein ACOCVL_02425 [Candidatus Sumerlaeota bacterium]